MANLNPGDRVLLLGASGLLGHHLAPCLASSGFEVISHSRQTSADVNGDFADAAVATSLLDAIEPDFIVNLIGLTNVDTCEADPDLAFRVNCLTVENVASWIRARGTNCHLVHISTDHVYDGPGPHDESRTVLRNYYAFSKYCAEKAAQSVGATVIRTNFFGRSRCSRRETLTDWLFRSLAAQEPVYVFDDVHFSPLSLSTVSRMVATVTSSRTPGIFNLGSSDGLTKASFAALFAEKCDLPTATMKSVSIDTVTTLRARRPKDMRMISQTFEETFSLQLPNLASEIATVAREYTIVD